MATRIRNHVRSNIIGFLALFLVLTTGSALALNGSNTVFSDDIVNGQVKSPDLGANAVATGKIADGGVTTADLGANSVSSGKIAANAVNSSKVADNSLTGADVNEAGLGLVPNADKLDGIDSTGIWKLGGNAGTSVSDFLGTTGNQPLNLRVNNARGLRLEPASDGTDQSPNVIGGVGDNQVSAGVYAATIAGGGRSVPASPATANLVTDNQGTVGGGAGNRAGDGTGTVGDAERATVGGGTNNTASGSAATVGGGASNSATNLYATVSGGAANQAGGLGAMVPGGFSSAANGDGSFAAGFSAKANDPGAFVWADSAGFDFASTSANEFSVRSTGGARFVSAINGSTGVPTAGVTLAPGGGSWSSLSDEASKAQVTPVSGREVLRKLASVPVSEWSYRAQGPSVRHLGPMAQDFYDAFGVGEDRRHIDSVDADGVALAGIKGLGRELRIERRRRHKLEGRLDALEARLGALEREEAR